MQGHTLKNYKKSQVIIITAMEKQQVTLLQMFMQPSLLAMWVVALLFQLLLLPVVPLLGQTIAVILITALLPGYLLVQLIVGRTESPPALAERLLYSVGIGYSSMVIAMLALSYLPGGLTWWQGLLWFDGWLFLLLLLFTRQQRQPNRQSSVSNRQSLSSSLQPLLQQPWLLIGVIVLVGLGILYRFGNLGYAEFQGDEARLALRAAEIIQGYEGALFVHKKGPVEILLPTVIYVLTGHLTETTARLPFALANFTAIFAMFTLGRRLFGAVAGWVAALVIALDGYLIAFGRVVQYQSIVLLMTVLLVLLLVRLSRQPQALTRYLVLAALLFTTGLLAHYEVLLAGLPALFLLWQIGCRVGPWALVRAALLPAMISAVLLGSFYLPFALYPEFTDTSAYLVGYRLGLGGLYNNLATFFQRTTLYSSTYYLLLLVLGTVLALLRLYWRTLPPLGRWLASLLLLGGLGLTVVRPDWLTVAGQDYTGLFFLACMLSTWLLATEVKERLVWFWFGAAMVIAIFLTAIPNTHVYSFFIPWALLTGMVGERAWQRCRRLAPLPLARAIVIPGAATLIALFGVYEYWLFVYHDVEVLRTWPAHRLPGYWTTYDEPVEVAIFGFPLNNGWKAVAGLYADGELTGPYATNARAEVADWYTRGDGNCSRDEPTYYILVNPVEPTLADETEELRRQLLDDHRLWGTVMVAADRPGLEIYTKLADATPPQQVSLAAYANRFDQTLSTPYLERNGPVGTPAIQATVDAKVGDNIRLLGYRLGQPQAVAGAHLTVTLYWQALAPVPENYAVFLQLIDLSDARKAGQRDGEPGCNTYPTQTWVPGTIIADRYDMPIDDDALPGPYTLLAGLVTTDGVRLPITDAAGQSVGDALSVTTVAVSQ